MEIYKNAEFAEFRHKLQTQPEVKMRKLLKKRADESKDRLLTAFVNEDLDERRKAVAEFSLVSMAKERALKIAASQLYPSWINVARADLRSFVEEDQDSREVLLGSIFFADGWDMPKKLDSIVNAMIEPRGEYNDRSFIAGVAMGEITVSTEVSGALVKKYVPTEVS